MPADGRFTLSHLELYVRDLVAMRAFYTGVLGFAVTDEGGSKGSRMVFLSRDPAEHHQLVLAEGRPDASPPRLLNHVSFRVESLATLRAVLAGVQDGAHGPVEQVTHGTTWSVYFRDPDGNRLECFVDTPWYTPQPFREPLDFALSDADIRARTEAMCRARPGFRDREDWLREATGRVPAAPAGG